MHLDRTRVGWVDYAKGFCIVMVVMMHSTLGVDKAAGTGAFNYMDALVAFALPFRMPDFFLISGLFLARAIDRDWRTYLDKKVVHFAYFYALWVTIQFAFKAPGLAHDLGAAGVVEQYFISFVQPFGTLWFIYLLPIFFVVVKLTRRVPPAAIFAIGCALQVAPIETGSMVIDEFCYRFVYFFAGYWLSPYIFRLAQGVIDNQRRAIPLLIVWAAGEAAIVWTGYSMLPGISLILGFIGAVAVVTFSALLSTWNWARPLRYAGQNSIVVYLAFFLPMAAMRQVLLKFAPGLGLGTISLIVTAVAAVMPLILFEAVKETRLGFLFRRPDWARLKAPEPRLVPATAMER